jgi:hypothetical protein
MINYYFLFTFKKINSENESPYQGCSCSLCISLTPSTSILASAPLIKPYLPLDGKPPYLLNLVFIPKLRY